MHTVPTFNCCTKCLGSPGRNTRPYAQLSSSFLDMDVLRTSLLKVSLIRKLCWSLVYLVYFFDMLFMDFVQPGTVRLPVDWCRNQMSVLYNLSWYSRRMPVGFSIRIPFSVNHCCIIWGKPTHNPKWLVTFSHAFMPCLGGGERWLAVSGNTLDNSA